VNEPSQENQLVKKLYKDIILGCSVFYNKNESVYFKHLTEFEFGLIQEQYIKILTKSKKEGLLDEKDKVDFLCQQGVWSKENEDSIIKYENEILNHQTTLQKLIIKSQINEIKNKIKDIELKLKKLNEEKEDLLGLTAEKYSLKKSNEYILYISLYKDESLNNKLFETNQEDFFDLDDSELMDYIAIYRSFVDLFKTQNLKKIAVSPFFMNNFFLCEDNPFIFYGKPIVHLTQYQTELFSIARMYKNHISKIGQTPPNNLKNLDELIAWYENSQYSSSLKNNQNDQLSQTYIGASKEELKAMVDGPDVEVVDLEKEAQKIGGDLSFDQILKIHGI